MANKEIAAELGIRYQVIKNDVRAVLNAAGMGTGRSWSSSLLATGWSSPDATKR
jgi:hypothetical protein